MGTFQSFRKAYGALKDSTTVGLAKVNSEFKVAIKTLIVIHRTLREGDPTFRGELLKYFDPTFREDLPSYAQSHRVGRIYQVSNFKDDSSPLAWDCSAWIRTYALFLEERLECFRTLRYDIEAERLTKSSPRASKVHSRTRLLTGEELLEQLPALQQLLYRLIGCQPEGAACHNYLVQYALALVLKESFKIYCAINDGIINLVEMFFDMSKHDAVKALNIYKRAGQQAESLAEFYDFCKTLDLARNFQFPTLRQPPPSFLATMEEYIKEAPQIASASNRKLEYQDTDQEPEEPAPETEKDVDEVEDKEPMVDTQEEPQPKNEIEAPSFIATEETGDLLGLNEVNPKAVELEESNAMALAIFQPGSDSLSTNNGLNEIGNSSGWELALVTTPSNNNSNVAQNNKLAGGFDKLLLDSLYEDDAARRQLQLQHAGYNAGYGYEMTAQNPFDHQDPFAMSNSIAPPPNVQMAMMQLQQQQQMMQQHMMMMVPHQYHPQYSQQQMQPMGNPFGDPFSYPQTTMPPQGNHTLL
ncbi:hypothetical protein RJ639_033214 [Escallonia herrerae]|uniref:ENTH domain-containing protein n=1 Tax=Escallonia herrerae TaxID=1293975 RepID=A0AA89BAL4_9ASTE|nr:hypothetical protein RJ639_033214 [Escallonia herrerae]